MELPENVVTYHKTIHTYILSISVALKFHHSGFYECHGINKYNKTFTVVGKLEVIQPNNGKVCHLMWQY